MLARTHRFHGYNSLRHVYRHGKTVRNQLGALRFTHNDRRETFRMAVVVSRKVSKSAVVRNRIRRRIYERVRVHAPLISQPYDLVVTVFHDAAATVEATKLDHAIVDLLSQAGVIPTGSPQEESHAIVEVTGKQSSSREN